MHTLAELDEAICQCRACPRLIQWCQQVAQERRAAYRDEVYWGGPVPGFGSDAPTILIVGLAPGAHGANRTGRMFTGDRSGEWLFASLHRVGLAALPTSQHRFDGQELRGVRITAAVHCAPPGNKPTTLEFATCASWLEQEWVLVRRGSARLQFEDEAKPRDLCAGDSLLISPHRRHRVVATDPAPGTLWLALFSGAGR